MCLFALDATRHLEFDCAAIDRERSGSLHERASNPAAAPVRVHHERDKSSARAGALEERHHVYRDAPDKLAGELGAEHAGMFAG